MTFYFRLDRWSNQLFAKLVAKNSKRLILRPHVPVAEGRCPKKQSVKIAKDGKKQGTSCFLIKRFTNMTKT